ncbi:hypothetical protein [Microcoleus sp. S13_B4]|uniref:hypothetical protein n=1 Tax=Microcoleus sp. S13_B4 TaxID=3055408 RepID=UPI002FD0A2C8
MRRRKPGRSHRCLLYARNPYLICAVHPTGPNADTCLDFRENPDAEPDELWEPEGASYYNGELILQPRQRWTLEQFTGRCPQCSHQFPKYEIPQCIGIVRSVGGSMVRCSILILEQSDRPNQSLSRFCSRLLSN